MVLPLHSNRVTDSRLAARGLDTTKANSWMRFAALRIFWGSKLGSGGEAPSGMPLFRYPRTKYRYLLVAGAQPEMDPLRSSIPGALRVPMGPGGHDSVSQWPAPAIAGLGSVLAEGLILRDRHSPADSSLRASVGRRLQIEESCREDPAGLMWECRDLPHEKPRENAARHRIPDWGPRMLIQPGLLRLHSLRYPDGQVLGARRNGRGNGAGKRVHFL